MSSQLATRCSACGTAFRVVRDQLKVSEGWVRCGRCETVFNALEQLLDLRRDAPPPAAASTEAGGERPRLAPLRELPLPELPAADMPKPPPTAGSLSALLPAHTLAGGNPDAAADAYPRDVPPAASPAAARPAADRRSIAALAAEQVDDARLPAAPAASPPPVDLLLDVPGDDPPPLFRDDSGVGRPARDRADSRRHRPDDAREADDAERHVVAAADDADGAVATPEFVRAAERDARWRRRPVRWALIAMSALLATALALQLAHHFRDGLAARWPPAQPLLAGWCGLLGCRLEAPRRIADLTVESTALTPAGGLPGTFQLSVTLRNRGTLAVALPAVDLSLTDSNGQLVSRRALLAAELTAAATPALSAAGPASTPARGAAPSQPQPLLRPDTDTRLQAVLATDSRVVGYTVELFYP